MRPSPVVFALILSACGGRVVEQDCPDAEACASPTTLASVEVSPELAPVVGRWNSDPDPEWRHSILKTIYFRADHRYGNAGSSLDTGPLLCSDDGEFTFDGTTVVTRTTLVGEPGTVPPVGTEMRFRVTNSGRTLERLPPDGVSAQDTTFHRVDTAPSHYCEPPTTIH
ncbi:MAG: hypothetical protein M3Z05_23060 [Gemmatimonadota bacterium]|nr:hypothetical protein [Gemmatimonadota bacterium]